MNTRDIRKTVIRLMNEAGFFAASDKADMHLFYDAAMDSLAFINLLLRIETVFGIVFDITQMEDCAELPCLLELINQKLGENDRDQRDSAEKC